MIHINPQLKGKTNVEFNKTNFPHLYGSLCAMYVETIGNDHYVETTLNGEQLKRTLEKVFDKDVKIKHLTKKQ